MCCSGYDSSSNPVIDFIKEYYLTDLQKVNNYVWVSNRRKKIVIDSYHFSKWGLTSENNIQSEAEKIRDSIIEAISKGFTF